MHLLDVKDLKKEFGIGLTGGVASGKSTIARMIASEGHPVYDADQLARQVVEPGTEGLRRITEAFGKEVLTGDGRLDRPRLSKRIFAKPSDRAVLEGILHPLIREALGSRLEADGLTANPRPWFYEAALLFETDTAGAFREIWVAFCPEEVQVERLMARDGKSEAEARSVLASQMPLLTKARRADLVLDTNASLETLRERVLEALEALGTRINPAKK